MIFHKSRISRSLDERSEIKVYPDFKVNSKKTLISLRSSRLPIFFFLLILNFYLPSWALESDQKLPLTITSDQWKYNRNTGVAIYQGTVKLDQGTTHLTADQLTVYVDKQNKIIKAIALGNPAHFNTIMQQNKPPVFAQANKLDYELAEHKIILQGKAQVTQEQNKFNGEHVEYDTVAKVITTIPQHHERTTMIIQPQQSKEIK